MPSHDTLTQGVDSVQVRPRRQFHDQEALCHIPRYHVILWNDDDHTYEYVIRMLMQLFGHPFERAYQLAKEVDTSGQCIVLTTTKEHAELKRDQIHAFGRDPLVGKCRGSMSATIEPATE